jgi:hypothetical protein
MADRRNTGNNRNNRNTNNNNTVNSNYEEAEPYNNRNRPNTRNWRLRFSNSRKVRPIGKKGRSHPVGTKHKTRTRRLLAPHFPNEENVLAINQSSSHASRVASESAQLHAKHDTLQEMLQELEAKPMNRRVKNSVRANLMRKFYNLTGPMPLPLPLPQRPLYQPPLPQPPRQFPVIAPQFRMQAPLHQLPTFENIYRPHDDRMIKYREAPQYPAYPVGYTPANVAGAPAPAPAPAPSAPPFYPGNNDLYN